MSEDQSEENEFDSDMYLVKEDTPINKATLLDLDLEKQRQFIAKLQERRLRAREIVSKARKTQAKTKSAGKLAISNKFEKLGDKLEKLLDKIENDLSKAEKIADEIKVFRMIEGDHDE